MNYAAMRYVAETCTVQGAGRALLYAIAYRADRTTGECWTALRRLAKEAGIDYATAKRVKLTLLNQGHLEIILDGAGRRPNCLRILGSERTVRSQDESVVGASEDCSGRIAEPVVGASGTPPYKGEKGKNVEGLEGRAGVAAPDGAAPRLNNGVPPDAAAAIAAFKAALHPPTPVATQPDPTRPPSSSPSGSVARPVSAAAAHAQQAAPDPAAKTPRRRTTRGRKGRRGREPPATSTRSTILPKFER